MTTGTTTSFDGIPIYYEEYGPKTSKKIPIVFCYGLVCAMTQWRYQIAWFKKNYRCVMLDYRGHHKSGTPKDPSAINVENCAKDVLTVMDHLNIPEAHLIGHSMGSTVALLIAYNQPKRVRSIVSICSSPSNPFDTMFHTHLLQYVFEFLQKYQNLAPAIMERIWKHAVANNFVNRTVVATLGFNRKLATSNDIEVYMEGVSRLPLRTLSALLDSMQEPIHSLLPQIKTPTLVVSGEKDLIQPAKNQKALYEKLPNAEWLNIPYGSHCAHLDMNEFVNLRMEKFLEARTLKTRTTTKKKKT